MDVEERARAQGWKGPEEYSGPPEKFKDAEEFLKVADDYAPVIKERNRRLIEQLDELNQKYDRQNQTLQKLAQHHKRTAELAYQRALRDLEKRRRDAVELGDTTAFTEVEAEIKELHAANVAEPDPAPVQVPQANPDKEAAEKWFQDNPWFFDDLTLHMAAQAAGNIVDKKFPNYTAAEKLAWVKKTVMDTYPDRFEQQEGKKEKVSPVLGGSGSGKGGNGRKKSYADLPGDAKKACDDFVKQGLMTRDDYVTDYFAE